MSDHSDDILPSSAEPAEDEEDWAAEIKRLRAERGKTLAERLATEPEEEPPA